MKFSNILETIGNTPIIKIRKLFPDSIENRINIWIKLERFNPGLSIKDRIALKMVEDAEKSNILQKGSIIVEPTSGNTGIGLAIVAAVKGYRLILVMPESMSIERRKVLSMYGAELELTPKELGMKGAIDRAHELVKKHNGWMPMQFENKSNIEAHMQNTAQEILKDFPQGIDYLFCGVGTGGHITGLSSILKKQFKTMQVIAIEPSNSPIISEGKSGPHAIQGIGAGFVPKNYNSENIDKVVTVTNEEAYFYTREISLKEGISVGISSGASLAAINKELDTIKEGSNVLTFGYDIGERYFSVPNLF